MTTHDTEIVSALRDALAGKVGKERFELWFGAKTRFDLADDTLTINVPNRFFKDWLRSNFRRQIESACRETLGRSTVLVFRIDDNLSDPNTANVRPDDFDRTSLSPKLSGPESSATPPESSAKRKPDGPQPPTPQRRNGFRRRPFADLKSFVEGRTNRLARAAAEMVARQPGEFSPLTIFGPTSVGKTHLLESIWTAARRASRNRTVIYLSAEQFTTDFLEALRGGGLPSFRQKYRGVDLLLVDDLQFFAGKRATLVELLYTVDTLLRQGRQLVLAADRHPTELSDLGPELITRLQSGMVCRIEPPDHPTRLGILAQMADRLGVKVPPEVRQFIASRLTNHARELSGALCRLQATSQALNQPISLPMAEEALVDMIRDGSRVVRLPDIERAVCDAFGLQPASLQSGRRAKCVSQPRMLAMWLARKYTRAALSEIGHYFGRRAHSTVISAQKRVDRWLTDGTTLDLADRTWNVDDAIRQVERCLKAG